MAKYNVSVYVSGRFDVEVESDTDPADGDGEAEVNAINKVQELIIEEPEFLEYEIFDVREIDV